MDDISKYHGAIQKSTTWKDGNSFDVEEFKKLAEQMKDNYSYNQNVTIPYISTDFTTGPTTMELAEALQECFRKMGPAMDAVATKPLKDLIKRYKPAILDDSSTVERTVHEKLDRALDLLKQAKDSGVVEIPWCREVEELLKDEGKEE